MKHQSFHIGIFIGLLLSASITVSPSLNTQEKTLESIYRTGKVRFVPEIVLDDESTPDDVFFEGYEHASSIVVDEKDNVYIADLHANHIKVFDKNGAFLKTLGRAGQGPGEFNMPYTMAYTNGRLAIWNMRNMSFTIISTEGEHLKSRAVNRLEEGWPSKIRALPNGNILVETSKSDRNDLENYLTVELRLYSPEMEYLKTVYSHIVYHRKFLKNLRRDIPAPFAARVCWEVTSKGNVAIGFSGSYEIEIHDPEKGKISFFSHENEPIKVSNEDKKHFFDGITSSAPGGGVTRGAPDYIRDNTDFPKHKPAFNQIMVDSEGNFLISQFGETPDEDYKSFDAFNPKGEFIGRVNIVDNGAIPFHGAQIKNRTFWIGTSELEDLIQVFKYRISE